MSLGRGDPGKVSPNVHLETNWLNAFPFQLTVK